MEPLLPSDSVSISIVRSAWNGRDYGNNLCFRRFWFVKDSCGIVCAVFTWLLLAYAEFTVNTVIISSAIARDAIGYAVFNGILFNGLLLCAFLAHLRTVMTEPGIVPRNTASDEQIKALDLGPGTVLIRCPKCVSIKPSRAHHCSICRRCVRKMDHHCPWVNNCVGENNQKFFVLFTMYIALVSLHAIILVVNQFILCVDKEFVGCSAMNPPASIILLIFLLFEGLLFFLFTVIMFSTQVCSIWNDETGIEQLQNDRERSWARRQRCQGLRSVFGDRFSMWWLSPLSPPRIGHEKPYQYSVLATMDDLSGIP
ncbi:palmitoyltransferase ZDHHC3-like [Paramacrobiotus metropolitanus]|uniref:palmitoyltransferase ZDHHC3-like n=1 Tax=Paramacrobiotus metropolitanus TaxID=2943436 RepID=UPI0024461774|nr:palmitoyltransferase ZDHHC3-like [Paramacrobiotus metropolitanus]XP_055357853.1 palmitoyltransferase ZDHHC3-like [Paramacrobiotus metropolitanus]